MKQLHWNVSAFSHWNVTTTPAMPPLRRRCYVTQPVPSSLRYHIRVFLLIIIVFINAIGRKSLGIVAKWLENQLKMADDPSKKKNLKRR